MKNFMSFLIIFSFGFIALPQEEEVVTKDPVQQTQQLMKDTKAREKAIADDKEAQKSHEFVKKVSGSAENTDQMYGIAADLLPWIMKEAGDDPAKATQLMQEALKDPKGFLERMPGSEKSKIQELSGKVPKGKNSP